MYVLINVRFESKTVLLRCEVTFKSMKIHLTGQNTHNILKQRNILLYNMTNCTQKLTYVCFFAPV